MECAVDEGAGPLGVESLLCDELRKFGLAFGGDEPREFLDSGDDDPGIWSSSCLVNTAVEVLEFAAPFWKRSYSRIVL